MGHPAAEPPFEEGEPDPIPRPKGGPDGSQPDWLVGPDEGLSAEAQENRPSMPRLTLTPGGVIRPPAPTPLRVVPGGGTGNLGVPRADELPEISSDVRTRAFSSTGKAMDDSLYAWQRPAAEGEAATTESSDPTDVDATVMVPPKKARAAGPQAITPIVVIHGSSLMDDDDEPVRKKSDLGASLRQFFGNPVLQIGVACAIGAAALWFYAWPRMNPGVSISSIRRNAAKLDGRVVSVRGRVGEVFPVGASYVFYLHQGRDTLVVFSSLRMPTPEDELLVTGKISTGFLEGVPRAALFEQTQ